MSRIKSFLARHELPDREHVPPPPFESWDSFFGPQGAYVSLGVVELNPTVGVDARPSLANLLLTPDAPPVVLLCGPPGSGKTVEAVRAFRELRRAEDRGDDGSPALTPVWLCARGAPQSESPLTDFLTWVADSAGLRGRKLIQIADWLDHFPRRAVFFADLTTAVGSWMSAALTEAVGVFDRYGFVVVVRDPGSLVLPPARRRVTCRVRVPDENDRQQFRIPSGVWEQVEGHLDEFWRTPQVYSFLARPEAQGDGELHSVSDLYDRITRHQLAADVRERGRQPLTGLLAEVWEQSNRRVASPGEPGERNLFINQLVRLTGVFAVRLLDVRLPRRFPSDIEIPFLPDRTGDWNRVLADLGFDLARTPRCLYPIRDKYRQVDGLYVLDRSLFARIDLHPGHRFVPDALGDYFAGAIALPDIVGEMEPDDGLDWVVSAAAARPEVWAPVLPFYAGRLDQTRFLLLLGRLIELVWSEGGGGPPAAVAGLAASVLGGRPWRGADRRAMWTDEETGRLRGFRDELDRHSFLLARWPELLPSICRERLVTGRPESRLGRWIEETTVGKPRLDRVPAAGEKGTEGPGRARSARLHAGPVVRVLASEGWVYVLGADGVLIAWQPATGHVKELEFGRDGSPVTAAALLPGGGLVVGRQDGAVWLWPHYPPWTPVRVYQHPAAVASLDSLPDPLGQILVGHEDGFVFRASSVLRPSTRLELCGDHRTPVRHLTAFGPDAYILGTADGAALAVVREPDLRPRAIPVAAGPPLTAVLPLPDGQMLLGWKNGSVTLVALDGTARHRLEPADEHSGWVGAVVGLAISDRGVWASDPHGRVMRLRPISPPTGGRLATGRLAWLDSQLVIGDRGGCAHIVPPEEAEREIVEPATRAITSIRGFTNTASGRPRLFALGRDGWMRYAEVGRDGLKELFRFKSPDPIAEDEIGRWAASGSFGPELERLFRDTGSARRPANRAGVRAGEGRHVGTVCWASAEDGQVRPPASGGGDRVIAVWPLPPPADEPAADDSVQLGMDLSRRPASAEGRSVGRPLADAAYFAPSSVTALAWLDLDHLCAGLATGELLVLRYSRSH